MFFPLEGRLVVFDRYTYDALLPITGSWLALKRPYFRVLAHLAPRPDLVLVLEALHDLARPVEADRRREALRPLERAARRAVVAACEPTVA